MPSGLFVCGSLPEMRTRPSYKSYGATVRRLWIAETNCAYGGLRVIQAGDDGVVEDRDALSEGQAGVVEDSVVVGEVGKTKASDTLHCSVDDKERSIRKSCEKPLGRCGQKRASEQTSLDDASVSEFPSEPSSLLTMQVMTRFEGCGEHRRP